MAATTTLPTGKHDVPGLPDRPISVEEYHARIADGTLVEGSPYELLEGWVTAKMPHGPRHAWTVHNLHRRILRMLPAGWDARGQMPTATGDSEAEPDVTVHSAPDEALKSRHPTADETALVAEVADSTLARDRRLKMRIFAGGGIPVYWIVNLPDRRVEVHTDPVPEAPGREARYASRRDYLPGESVPLVINGRAVGEIPVSELLP